MAYLHLFKRQGWRLGEQLEHLVQQLVQIQFVGPRWVHLPTGPLRDVVILDSVVLFNVVEQLDHCRVHWLI